MKIKLIFFLNFVIYQFLFGSDIKSGLLIGYTYDKDYKIEGIYSSASIDVGYTQKLRTVWIATEKDSFKSIVEFPEIIVPTDSSFWRLSIKRSVYNRCIQDFLLAYPLEIGLAPPKFGIKIEFGENYDGIRAYGIDFVGNKYISLQFITTGYYKGAPTDYVSNDRYISLFSSDMELSTDRYDQKWIQVLLGESLYKKFIGQSKGFYNSLHFKNSFKDRISDTPTSIYITRGKGKWIMKGRFGPYNLASRAAFEDFVFSKTVPKNISGYDELDFSWQILKSLFPNINDAFMSPARDIIGIYRSGKIYFHKITRGKIIKQPFSVVKLNNDGPNLRIVMLQWAVGRHVERWTNYFKNISSNRRKYKFHAW